MCLQDHKLHLCGCSDSSPERMKKLFSSELKQLKRKEYFHLIKWTLYKYIKYEWSDMDGMLFLPTDKITAQLTTEYLCSEMNRGNCFDFEFTPTEGDSIIFEVEHINKNGRPLKQQPDTLFTSLIFRNNRWTIESYNAFYDKTEELKKGVITIRKVQNTQEES